MKKTISLLTIISVVLSMLFIGALSVSAAWDGTTVTTGFDSGTGTVADPYVIATPEQLAFLAQSVKSSETYDGKFLVLGADIDLGGKEWLPIGLYKFDNTSGNDFPFKGSFDGKGYTISNFVVSPSNSTIYGGLFGYAGGTDCVIQNLTVSKADITGKNYAGGLVGMFVGKSLKSITVEADCTVSGTASVGGIAGRISGGCKAEYLVNKATVTGTGNGNSSYIGGICGAVGSDAVISYSINYGKVCGDVAFAGGLVGLTGLGAQSDATLPAAAGGATIENCYNAGAVEYGASGNNRYIGGIGARLSNAASQTTIVKNTYNLGEIKNTSGKTAYIGEIAADVKNTGITFTNVYSVDIADVDLFMSGKVADGVDVAGALTKTEVEIKALTALIDAKIAENKVTPPTVPEKEDPVTPPVTGDVGAVVFAVACVTILTAVAVVKKKER